MTVNRTFRILGRLFLPKVKDLMVRDITVLDVNAPLIDAVQNLAEDDSNSVFIAREGVPTGIITRRDLICKCFFQKLDAEKITVGSMMSHPLVTINASENVMIAYELMEQKGIRRLAVLENGKLVGRIRLYDIQHLTSPTPVTAFYMMGYFLLGIIATVAAVLLIVAF